jgi:hypothetical protein
MAPTHYQTGLGDELGYELSPSWPCQAIRQEVPSDTTTEWAGLKTIPVSHDLPREIAYQINKLNWVVGGDVNSYIAETLDKEVSPPQSFQALSDYEWDPYVGLVHGNMAGYGYGIGRKKMEGILRVVAGGGKYDSGEITIFGCGTDPFIVDGPRGIVMGKPGSVPPPADTDKLPCRPIKTSYGRFNTVEGAQVIRAGLSSVLEYLPEIMGQEPISISQSSGVFIKTDDTTVRVDHDDLRSIGLSVSDPSNIITNEKLLEQVEEYADVGSRKEWEPNHRVGEQEKYGATCIGYRVIRHGYESRSQLPEHELPGIQSLYIAYAEDEHATDRLVLRRVLSD